MLDAELIRELERSKEFLTLEPNWDSYDGIPVPLSVWQRMKEFISYLALRYYETIKSPIPVPDIGPCGDGSIDLQWDLPGCSLLINIHNDINQTIGCYGDNGCRQNVFKEKSFNELEPSITQIVTWLGQRKEFSDRYRKLTILGEDQTRFLSSVRAIINHDAFQEIEQRGAETLPYLFHDLAAYNPDDQKSMPKGNRSPWWRFYIIQRILGESIPIKDGDRGKLKEVLKTFILWAKEQQYLPRSLKTFAEN